MRKIRKTGQVFKHVFEDVVWSDISLLFLGPLFLIGFSSVAGTLWDQLTQSYDDKSSVVYFVVVPIIAWVIFAFTAYFIVRPRTQKIVQFGSAYAVWSPREYRWYVDHFGEPDLTEYNKALKRKGLPPVSN